MMKATNGSSLAQKATILLYLPLFIPIFFQYFPYTNKFDLIQKITPLFAYGAVLAVLAIGTVAVSKLLTPSPPDIQPEISNASSIQQTLFQAIDLKVLAPLILFFLWSTASFFFAEVQMFGFTTIYVLSICTIAFTLFASANPQNRQKSTNFFFTLVTVISLTNAIGGFWPFLSTDHTRFFGLFFNSAVKADAWPNAYALFSLITLPLVTWFLFKKGLKFTSKFQYLWRSLVLALPLGTFFLSYSRAGIAAFVVACIFALLVFGKRTPKLQVTIIAAMVILFGLLVAILGYNLKSQNGTTINLDNRVSFQGVQEMSSFSERKEFFEGAMRLIQEKPIIGYGPASFRWVYPQFQQGFLAISDHPHNLFLLIAVESGIPAVIFFLVFLFAIFNSNSPFSTQTSNRDKFLWIALVGALTHSMVDHNLNFVSNAAIFWIILGILAQTHPQKPILHHPTKLIAPILLGLSSFVLITTYLIFLDGRDFEKGINRTKLLLPRWQYLQLEESLPATDLEARKALILKHLEINPHHAIAINRLAQIEISEKNPTAALELYQKIVDFDPRNTFEYSLKYLQLLKQFGKSETTISYLEKIKPFISEYQELYKANLHFTQSTPEIDYLQQIKEIGREKGIDLP